MNDNTEFQEEIAVNDGSTALTIISWLFGILFSAIGVVNTFWGGDTGFGIFIILLSLANFLPIKDILKKMTGFTIPKVWLLKIFLGMFIIWAAMGVGELFDKIEMMVNSLQ